MNEVMVDLETLDNVPGGVILSIGAVFFDWRARVLGPRFYTTISVASSKHYGLSVSADTLAWWEKQSPEARRVLEEAMGPHACPLPDALAGFGVWLAQHCQERDKNGLPAVNLWGNGSDFDNAFLQVAYARVGSKPQWNFWRNESFRTLKNRVGNTFYRVPKPEVQGTAHNALDDAVAQARHACELLHHLNRAESAYETVMFAKDQPGAEVESLTHGVTMIYAPRPRGDAEYLHTKGIAQAEGIAFAANPSQPEDTLSLGGYMRGGEFVPTHASINSPDLLTHGGGVLPVAKVNRHGKTSALALQKQEDKLRAVVAEILKGGGVPTVEQVSLPPFAMGRHITVSSVRAARTPTTAGVAKVADRITAPDGAEYTAD